MADATGTSELPAPTPLPRGRQTSRGRTWTERSNQEILSAGQSGFYKRQLAGGLTVVLPEVCFSVANWFFLKRRLTWETLG